MSVTALSTTDMVVIAVAALLIGVAKTSVAAVGSISVALFAAVLPARESTGAILPILVAGDLMAIAYYRRSADWATLRKLAWPVVVGVLFGVGFLSVSDDAVVRRTIGIVLLALVALHLATARRPARARAQGPVAHWGYGALGGFTTMVANAAGPVMSLYLLGASLEKLAFLGTIAWFFLAVNLFKVPFSIGLGLMDWSSLLLAALLLPLVLVGGVLGRALVGRLDQHAFETLVLVLTVVSALNLLR